MAQFIVLFIYPRVKETASRGQEKKKVFSVFLHDKLLARQSIKDFDLHKYVDTE